MAAYVGVLVSDPWLQNQFTQVELRTLKSHVTPPLLLLFINEPRLSLSSSYFCKRSIHLSIHVIIIIYPLPPPWFLGLSVINDDAFLFIYSSPGWEEKTAVFPSRICPLFSTILIKSEKLYPTKTLPPFSTKLFRIWVMTMMLISNSFYRYSHTYTNNK